MARLSSAFFVGCWQGFKFLMNCAPIWLDGVPEMDKNTLYFSESFSDNTDELPREAGKQHFHDHISEDTF